VKTPDLTRAQLLAVLQAAVAAAVAFGAPITAQQGAALLALAGALSVVLVGADAAIRRARAQHLAGPRADQEAATAIRDAAEASRTITAISTIDRIASEAAAEAAAQEANDAVAAQPPDGIDPATL
jgi:actin-like ATPase involved in cell morphogenesis